MKMPGSPEFIRKMDQVLARDREQKVARNIAKRLILEFKLPDSYVDLVSDPREVARPTLVHVVAQWVMGQAAEDGLSPAEIELWELENRFTSHLADVFDY